MPQTSTGYQQLTLLDQARRTDPDGKTARIVEMLNRENTIVQDAVTVEGNTQIGYLTTLRTGLPAITFRQLNAGVQPSKSTTKQIHFTAALLEGFSRVDERLIELDLDGPGLRMSEVMPFMESMGQTIASTMFYGDVRVNPARFTGLSAYFANLNTTFQQQPENLVNPSSTAPDSGRNVFDASSNYEGEVFGTPSNGNNTSIWLVCWGPQSVQAFFPRGTRAGIYHKDWGLFPVDDGRGLGATYGAWLDQYKAQIGLAVQDWRQVVRIANIDVIALASAGDDNDQSANLIKNMMQARRFIQRPDAGKLCFYANRTALTYLDVKMANKFNAFLKMEEIEGMGKVMTLLGIPIRRCDALLNTEAQVS